MNQINRSTPPYLQIASQRFLFNYSIIYYARDSICSSYGLRIIIIGVRVEFYFDLTRIFLS